MICLKKGAKNFQNISLICSHFHIFKFIQGEGKHEESFDNKWRLLWLFLNFAVLLRSRFFLSYVFQNDTHFWQYLKQQVTTYLKYFLHKQTNKSKN